MTPKVFRKPINSSIRDGFFAGGVSDTGVKTIWKYKS
jgi:hypothetical protein